MKTAYVAAGQGLLPSRAQWELALSLPDGARLLDFAASCVGLADRHAFMARGAAALASTAVLQPCIVAITLSFARVLPRPGWVAGHSLGELSAVAIAGALTCEEAIHLAAIRGAAMQAASLESPGGLYAIEPGHAGQALAIEGAYLALDNSPQEMVIGGPGDVIALLAKRIPGKRLLVAGPFHGPAMRPAAHALARECQARLENPSTRLLTPFVSSVTVETTEDARHALRLLTDAVAKAARFREGMLRLYELGAREFVILGPSHAIRGMLRSSLPKDIVIATIETAKELELRRAARAERSGSTSEVLS